MKLRHKNKRYNVKFARIIPTIGSPATLPIGQALKVFWQDERLALNRDLHLKFPSLEFVFGKETVKVDGYDVLTCGECGFIQVRIPELDYPIGTTEGYFECFKCMACGDEYYEPID